MQIVMFATSRAGFTMSPGVCPFCGSMQFFLTEMPVMPNPYGNPYANAYANPYANAYANPYAAMQNQAETNYQTGMNYLEGKNGVTKNEYTAVRYLTEAANAGHAKAQWKLGNCYRDGGGVSKNEYEAINWYRKSAEQGCSEGQHNLGWCYAHGKGVTPNDYEAVKWYRKAAEHGAAKAQWNLGMCYS